MILASTLICSVSATHGSRVAADAALELRQANELSAYLLEAAPSEPGQSSGQTGSFRWVRIVSEPVGTFGSGAICEHRVVLTALRVVRQYEAKTNAVCKAAS